MYFLDSDIYNLHSRMLFELCWMALDVLSLKCNLNLKII